jgi:phosphoglycolate phosphatase
VVVFDLDGTLTDPLEGIGRSINFALDAYGYDARPSLEIARLIGPPIDKIFALLTGSTDPRKIEGLVTKYRERYAEVGFAENRLYPGIPTMLAQLDLANMPMGVCTSKLESFARRILEMFGLLAHFSFVCGGDIGVDKRRQISELRAQGTVTSASLMIGDRAVDIAAAHMNGLQSAGALWGFGTRDELASENPRYLLETPAAISHLLLASSEGEQPPSMASGPGEGATHL